jgi:hypothetical protein
MQGKGVDEVRKALQQVEAAAAAINDIAGRLTGARGWVARWRGGGGASRLAPLP